jgi:NAD(P)H-hydrate epimerase
VRSSSRYDRVPPVRPVVTAAEMAAADAAIRSTVPLGDLIARAGDAVARTARGMLGGTYGRRVIVIAGKGHNGDDGRVAARLLARSGARVLTIDADAAPVTLPDADLVIDAAYGTGFRGTYVAPSPPKGAALLAVDIPSGVDADTGAAAPGAVRADVTVTFQAEKPGLLLGAGRPHSGRVQIADLGIPLAHPRAFHVDDGDVAALPARAVDGHKWQRAVCVCAGSPGMDGAAVLSALGAARAGSGMVRLAVPGGSGGRGVPLEIVEEEIPATGFADALVALAGRCHALVLGPGLGRRPGTAEAVAAVLRTAPLPIVLDADGITALGDLAAAQALLAQRQHPTVLTPHDGEYARLVGAPPGPDRVAAVRALAHTLGAVVLLKGPTTLVADADGEVRFVTSGTSALATAGTGDVLSGVVAAFLARGVAPIDAAATAAHVHGRAGASGLGEGLVASDLPTAIAAVLDGAG